MCGLASPKSERARAPRVAPSATAWRQVQRSVAVQHARCGRPRRGRPAWSATVVTASAHPGVRRTRSRSRASTVPAPQSAMVRRSSASYQRSSPATPVGSARGQGPQRRAPDQRRPGPERQRLHHVGGPAHAAVDVDLGPPGHGVDHLGQDVGRGRRVGELAGPVVGHHDGGRSGVDAAHGVVGPLHALDHDGQRAQPGQPPDVVGRERRLELVGHDGHEPTLARAVGAVAGQVGQGQVVGQVHAHAPLAQAEPRDGGVDGQDQGAGSRARRRGATSSSVRARSRRM